jgi:ribosomal protein S14
MFIHFNSEKDAECADCGNSHTIMHILPEHMDRSIHLCVACFRALAEAMSHASKKINRPQLATEVIGMSRPPNLSHKNLPTR